MTAGVRPKIQVGSEWGVRGGGEQYQARVLEFVNWNNQRRARIVRICRAGVLATPTLALPEHFVRCVKEAP